MNGAIYDAALCLFGTLLFLFVSTLILCITIIICQAIFKMIKKCVITYLAYDNRIKYQILKRKRHSIEGETSSAGVR